MYAGRIVENAPITQLFGRPLHPYAIGLQSSLVRLDAPPPPRLPGIAGTPPDPAHLPPGCAFAPRCAEHIARCANQVPALLQTGPDHWCACHLDRARAAALHV